MKDENHFADYYKDYGIIYDGRLPHEVKEEVVESCPSNDCGKLINPEYNPLFKQWLIDNDMPVECYIVWFSW